MQIAFNKSFSYLMSMNSPFIHTHSNRNTNFAVPKGRPYLVTLFEHQEFF